MVNQDNVVKEMKEAVGIPDNPEEAGAETPEESMSEKLYNLFALIEDKLIRKYSRLLTKSSLSLFFQLVKDEYHQAAASMLPQIEEQLELFKEDINEVMETYRDRVSYDGELLGSLVDDFLNSVNVEARAIAIEPEKPSDKKAEEPEKPEEEKPEVKEEVPEKEMDKPAGE